MLPFLGLLPAAFQLGQGIYQNIEANNLKESQYVPPELRMKRQLAQQQAFSRRAPGAAQAEEQNRRNLATSLSQARRNFGGDANKMASIAAGANAQANDATARIAAQGQQFSENAFGRVGQADSEIAAVKERNRQQYNQTKAELYRSSGQNLFNAASNLGSFAIAGGFEGIDPGVKADANAKIKYGEALQKGGKPMASMRANYDASLPVSEVGGKVSPDEALKRLRGDYTKAAKGTVNDSVAMGTDFINQGKSLKRMARKMKNQSVNQSLLMSQNPMMGMGYMGMGYNDPEYMAWRSAQGK